MNGDTPKREHPRLGIAIWDRINLAEFSDNHGS